MFRSGNVSKKCNIETLNSYTALNNYFNQKGAGIRISKQDISRTIRYRTSSQKKMVV